MESTEPVVTVPAGTSLPPHERPGTIKLNGLQFGRGLAAVLVIVTHAIAHPYPPGVAGVTHLGGRFGVTLFFVISGFIMVVTTGRGRFDPLLFMRRRVLRIAPLYYVATAITVAMVLIAPRAFKDTFFDLRQIILSILFIPTYAPGEIRHIDPVLRLGWTLNFEMFFYVAFACLSMLGAVRRAAALTALFGGLILLGTLVGFEAAIPAFYTRSDTIGFVAGVWLGVLALQDRLTMSARWAWVGTAVAVVSLALLASVYTQLREAPATQVWVMGTCTLIIAILVARESTLSRRLPRIAITAGDASYSLYLFHMFTVGAVTLAARMAGPSYLYVGMVGSALASFVLGWAVWRFVETPLNRFARRLPHLRALVRPVGRQPSPGYER